MLQIKRKLPINIWLLVSFTSSLDIIDLYNNYIYWIKDRIWLFWHILSEHMCI